jgi:hypothetical protein
LSEQLTYVYTAILDVLGYRSRLQDDRKNGTLSFKYELQRALQVLARINQADYDYQAISDTIIITCNKREEFIGFLQTVKSVILSFLKESLFVRGGITYSQHFKSSNITYSHAIALAHEIESNLAIFPRVVIDNNIIDMFYTSGEQSQLIDSGLICVQNGIFFLDILDKDNWCEVYGFSSDLFKREEELLHKRENDFLKHVWFENYIFSSQFADKESRRYIPLMQQLR